MKNDNFELPHEPKSQLDFLMMLGFVRWFDVPFIIGIITLPITLTVLLFMWPSVATNVLLGSILIYLMWLCILVFRCMHFVIKSIGEIKNVGYDAARMAANYLSGNKS
jgi:hypothetical protein